MTYLSQEDGGKYRIENFIIKTLTLSPWKGEGILVFGKLEQHSSMKNSTPTYILEISPPAVLELVLPDCGVGLQLEDWDTITMYVGDRSYLAHMCYVSQFGFWYAQFLLQKRRCLEEILSLCSFFLFAIPTFFFSENLGGSSSMSNQARRTFKYFTLYKIYSLLYYGVYQSQFNYTVWSGLQSQDRKGFLKI